MSQLTPSSGYPTAGEWDDLIIPRTDPLSMLRSFGPGPVLMMTEIGTSRVSTAHTAGGRFAVGVRLTRTAVFRALTAIASLELVERIHLLGRA